MSMISVTLQEREAHVASDPEFEKCIKFVLDREGGYVNHKNDPGGETNFGISKKAYPFIDIKHLTVEQAKRIYYVDYWLRGAQSLSWPLNLCFFDCAVNQGTKKAREFLAITEKAKGDWRKYLSLRREHYMYLISNNPKLKVFQKGWMNRLNELEEFISK